MTDHVDRTSKIDDIDKFMDDLKQLDGHNEIIRQHEKDTAERKDEAMRIIAEHADENKSDRSVNISGENVIISGCDSHVDQSLSLKATIEKAKHKNQPKQNENRSRFIAIIIKFWWTFIIPLLIVLIGLAIEQDWLDIMD